MESVCAKTKVCKKCGVEKELGDFSKHKLAKDRLRGDCRKCHGKYTAQYRLDNPGKVKAYQAKWHQENRELVIERVKQWAEANPEKTKATLRKYFRSQKGYGKYLERTYGIGFEDYLEMLKKQNGKCGICGRPEGNAKRDRLGVDHCHKTGRVRGLLCNSCNRGIGLLGDSADVFRAAIEWLS